MKILQTFENEKISILDFLEKNKNLPGAVRDALLMRLVTLSEYIELLDGMEVAA